MRKYSCSGPHVVMTRLRVRSEQLQDAQRLDRERFLRAEQRRLLVERLARPAHEGGRDDQRRAVRVDEQPGRRGRVPRRVAARLEGGPHAAGREARGVGLAPDQLLAAELRDRLAAVGRREKRVVLLGRDARERLEPVRVVRRAVLERPVLQRRRDDVRRGRIERLAGRDGAAQRLVDGLRQAGLLHLVVEGEAAERIGGLRQLAGDLANGDAPVGDAFDGVL